MSADLSFLTMTCLFVEGFFHRFLSLFESRANPLVNQKEKTDQIAMIIFICWNKIEINNMYLQFVNFTHSIWIKKGKVNMLPQLYIMDLCYKVIA